MRRKITVDTSIEKNKEAALMMILNMMCGNFMKNTESLLITVKR